MVNTGLVEQSDWIHSYSPPPLVFIQSPTPFTAVIISNTRLSLARAGNWAEISLHPGHKCCIYHKQARGQPQAGLCVSVCDRELMNDIDFSEGWYHYFYTEVNNSCLCCSIVWNLTSFFFKLSPMLRKSNDSVWTKSNNKRKGQCSAALCGSEKQMRCQDTGGVHAYMENNWSCLGVLPISLKPLNGHL